MRFRKPEPIPLLFIIGAVALLVSLGIWQVERLQWKNALIANIEKAQAAPTITYLPPASAGLEYRTVELHGHFLHDKSFRTIGAAPGVGGESGNGFHIVTPFVLLDTGGTILVDRGWSPPGKESKPEGILVVKGIIRPPHPKRFFSPENNLPKNIWFYDDFKAMANASGLNLMLIIVQQVGPQEKDSYPIPSDGKIVLRNDHLQYAITWLSLAVIAMVMFAFYHCLPEEKA